MRDRERVWNIYYKFPDDVDTRAVHSRLGFQRRWHERKLEKFISALPDGKRVLDVGCGSGGITFKIASLRRNSRIVAFDFNVRSILYARRRRERERANIVFSVAAAEELPFKSAYFDSVVCSDVLDHCLDHRKAMAEIKRVLKPGGRIYITVENRHSLWPVIEWLWDTLGGGRNYRQTHLVHFTRTSLVESLAEAGFEVEEMTTIHNYPSVFFNMFTDYYTKTLEELSASRCLGMTLFCVARKRSG